MLPRNMGEGWGMKAKRECCARMEMVNLHFPIIEWPLTSGDRVFFANHEASKKIRTTGELLGRFFRREMHYDFPPYSACEHDDRMELALWRFPDFFHPDFDTTIIGCAGFGLTKRDTWMMEWIWFHPFFRGRGILSNTWPDLLKRYGRFTFSKPISPAMGKFIRKQSETP